MRLCKPHFEILEQQPGLEGIYKSIELVGRVSHKSEDKITEDSAKTFVDRMMKMKHLSTCEFGTIYLKVPAGKHKFLDNDYFNECNDIKDSFYSNPYTKIHGQEGYHYISTNYRVLLENFSKEFIPKLLQYLCEPTEHHHKRYTVKFICDRGILAEFTRHRKFSFMAESTRYCNYSKDKFNNEITYILPCWIEEKDLPKGFCYSKDDWGSSICGFYYEATEKGKRDGINISPVKNFIFTLQASEQLYFSLLNLNWTPQQARAVLPNALKTELYMCGFAEDWKHFFELRCAANAHPQARELAIPLYEEFKNKNYIV